MFKRKENSEDLSVYKQIQYEMSNICALTENEFLIKYDECVVEVFKKNPRILDEKLNNWLGVENWRKHFDGPFPSGPTDLNISGYSNYQELMSEAHFHAEFIAKKAFKMNFGRLHRSNLEYPFCCQLLLVKILLTYNVPKTLV